MHKPTPNLGALKASLKQAAVPATHADPPTAGASTPRRQKRKAETQLVGAHLSPDVGKQLRMIAAEEDTDVKSLLVEAINLLFKTRGKPQIADDQVKR
jgi:hypothetical protein